MAQDHLRKDSLTYNCSTNESPFIDFPCDSLYKIRGLKNVTCNNYTVFRFEDMRPIIECEIKKLREEGLLSKDIKIIY